MITKSPECWNWSSSQSCVHLERAFISTSNQPLHLQLTKVAGYQQGVGKIWIQGQTICETNPEKVWWLESTSICLC